MASGKAAVPSGIIPVVLKPDSEVGVVQTCDYSEDVISEGCILTDWQESFIFNLYTGKWEAQKTREATTGA